MRAVCDARLSDDCAESTDDVVRDLWPRKYVNGRLVWAICPECMHVDDVIDEVQPTGLCPSCGRAADTAQIATTAIGHLTVCTFCGWDRTPWTTEETA